MTLFTIIIISTVTVVTPTYQDGGDDVGSVLQAVGVVAASHEAGSGDVLLIFIPVADLRHNKNQTEMKVQT